MKNNDNSIDDKLYKYIDNRFYGVGPSSQFADLKEELVINIKEKIADYRSQGMDEEVAFHKAATSMGDLSGLIEDMRRIGQEEAKKAIYGSMEERRTRKNALYWLLGTIYTVFISLQLIQSRILINVNYGLHEMAAVPINAAIFIGPIVLIIYLNLEIKAVRKYGFKTLIPRSKVKAALIIISLILVFASARYQLHQVSTSGLFEVKNKVQQHQNYYLVLEDKKIKVSRSEFNLVDVNEQYMISFSWNPLSPEKGKLIYIERFSK
jgi:hypothetical protein